MTIDALVAREFPRLLGDAPPYLNNAATGPIPERAVAALHHFNEWRAEPWRFTQEFQFDTLARSRQLVARLVGARPEEIALMGNTTYGLNLAARALPLAPGEIVLIPGRDFPSNVYPWLALERTRGVEVQRVACRGRLFDEDLLLAALDQPGVRIMAVSWVSFESGVRLDLHRLGQACRDRGVYFVVDAIQGLGAETIDLSNTPVDIFSCGAQKWLLSPWGTGFVYVRRELVTQLEPHAVGWMAVRDSDDFSRMLDHDLVYRDDARRFEVVTLPFQDFAGMNGSLEVFHEAGPAAIAARVRAKADRIVAWAQATRGMTLVTPAEGARRAGIVAVIPPNPVDACRRLQAAGVAHSLREGAIRLSPHFFTPDAHIDRALGLLEGA